MFYFTLQIRTGEEKKYIGLAQKSFPDCNFIFPERRMAIRRKGKTSFELTPLFSGYVFFENPTEIIEPSLFLGLRKTPGFYRFLKDNTNPIPLSIDDTKILQHFMDFGKIAEPSLVTFNENQEIVIKEGPLQGLEGKIVKVDKRKQRVKVSLDMYEKNFLIDLAIQIVDSKVGEK